MVENLSDKHLFLQEGDLLKGGQQDRTIYASHVVPPQSGKQALPAFCVEPSRWGGGKAFVNIANCSLAPQSVRQAAKYYKDQGAVWAQVANERKAITAGQGEMVAEFKTTSLNEALDAPAIKKISDRCVTAMNDIVADHPDVVGVAIAVNGRVEEVNVYPNHRLLQKQYSRLIASYAIQAATEGKKKHDALTPKMVAQVMLERGQQPANVEAPVAHAMNPNPAGNAVNWGNAPLVLKPARFYAVLAVPYTDIYMSLG